MPKVRLAASAEPVELEFKYALSDVAVDEFVAETGKMPQLVDGVVVAFTDLNSDLRRRAAMIRVAVLQQYELIDEDPLADERDPRDVYPLLDEPTDSPAIVIAAWESFLKARADRARAREEKKKREELTEKKQRDALRSEMKPWIEAHGSERLKTAFERGYKVVSSYVRERAAIELPGFAVDMGDKAKWEERANPSEKALALETQTLEAIKKLGQSGCEVRIVWLTRDENGNDLGTVASTLRKREVIVVEKYLGFYDLIGGVEERAK